MSADITIRPKVMHCRYPEPHDGHLWSVSSGFQGLPIHWCVGWITLTVTTVNDADLAAEMYER